MKEKISMILFVLILGVILTAALVAVDHYTEPRIKKNQERKIKTRVLGALGITYNEDNVEESFSGNIETRGIENKDFYVSKDGNIAFEIMGSGLWGDIKGILAVSSSNLETIKGIAIIHQEETPGLGGRIVEDGFLNTFKGKKLLPALTILPASKKAAGENEVDGITGATLTCKAFETILNAEAMKYLPLLRRRNDDI
jgi:Na+-transporting NADH:ubiquinone oxidoreductase subunit C